MPYPAIAAHRCEMLLREAQLLPGTSPAVRFPEWYLRQWHFHRDGYLSRAAIRRYELVIDRLYNAGRARLVDDAVQDLARTLAPRSVVELGCGTGRLAAALGRELPGADIVGVDLSPFMLERARERCAELSNVSLVHADATDAADLPADIDLVVAAHVLGHTPAAAAKAILENAAASLTARGVIATVEHRWHRAPALPSGLQLWRRRSLLGGILTLREYRRSP